MDRPSFLINRNSCNEEFWHCFATTKTKKPAAKMATKNSCQQTAQERISKQDILPATQTTGTEFRLPSDPPNPCLPSQAAVLTPIVRIS